MWRTIRGALKSKTFLTNTLLVAVDILSGAAGVPIPLSPATKMYALAVINLVLRTMTTKPLSEK